MPVVVLSDTEEMEVLRWLVFDSPRVKSQLILIYSNICWQEASIKAQVAGKRILVVAFNGIMQINIIECMTLGLGTFQRIALTRCLKLLSWRNDLSINKFSIVLLMVMWREIHSASVFANICGFKVSQAGDCIDNDAISSGLNQGSQPTSGIHLRTSPS